MSEHKLVPIEAFKIIPKFDGDVRHLNLFLRKCEYVINKFKSSEISEEYLMQVVTSRLRGDAAAFVSEHGDINTWEEFKELIKQQFDDPRSEEGLVMVLENIRIKPDENYTNFYRRIQSLKSILISKVDVTDSNKKSKGEFYDHIALQVFLLNLPEDVVTIIRMKKPSTLREALSMVLDEITFSDQYKMRSKWMPIPRQNFTFGMRTDSSGYKATTFGSANTFGTSNACNSPASFGSQPNNLKFGTSGSFGRGSTANTSMDKVKPMLPQQFGNTIIHTPSYVSTRPVSEQVTRQENEIKPFQNMK